MFGLSQNIESSKYSISVYKTREAERTMPFRCQGKQNFSFIVASDIPLVLGFQRSEPHSIDKYLWESHRSVTSASFQVND